MQPELCGPLHRRWHGSKTRDDIVRSPLHSHAHRWWSRVSSRWGEVMRGRSGLVVVGLMVTSIALTSTPASAQPIDKGHFHDSFTSKPYNCHGTKAQDKEDGDGNFVFNLRGSSPFPYYGESVNGSVVTTNLKNDGTFTQVFTATTRDHTIVDNGNGTITITTLASGGSRYYDTHGKLVLKDSGEIRFAVDINYNRTPGNPDDDAVVDGSFHLVRPSTGTNDVAGRDFCADLVTFSS